MNKRNYTYDLLRVLCMIWIVCFWHLTDYYHGTKFYDVIHGTKLSIIVYIALAAFTFLSGFFLGRYKIHSISDAISFYKKRFCRVYFLFLISLVTLYFTAHPIPGNVYISGIKCLIYSAIGLSMIKTPAPSTLWFMEMLLLFYAFTPPLLWVKAKCNKLIVVLICCGLIAVMYELRGLYDERLLKYAPYYLIGLLMGVDRLKHFMESKFKMILIVAFIIALLMDKRELATFFGLGTVLVLINYFRWVENNDSFRKLISILSTASFAAYLFHRQLYYLFFNFGIPVCLHGVIIFIVSYYIQIFYNKIDSRLSCKKRNVYQ